MSDKDDIFDMEFGEEIPSSPQKHRFRSTSLSVTLSHSKALLASREYEAAKSRDNSPATTILEQNSVKSSSADEAPSEEDNPDQENQENQENETVERERRRSNTRPEEAFLSSSATAPSKNYNSLKMKYFHALNIAGQKSSPIAAAPRRDPDEMFRQPIQSAPTHSAPIPIAEQKAVAKPEITGQTLDSFIPPHQMAQMTHLAQMGRGQQAAFWDRPKKKMFPAI